MRLICCCCGCPGAGAPRDHHQQHQGGLCRPWEGHWGRGAVFLEFRNFCARWGPMVSGHSNTYFGTLFDAISLQNKFFRVPLSLSLPNRFRGADVVFTFRSFMGSIPSEQVPSGTWAALHAPPEASSGQLRPPAHVVAVAFARTSRVWVWPTKNFTNIALHATTTSVTALFSAHFEPCGFRAPASRSDEWRLANASRLSTAPYCPPGFAIFK